MSKEQKECKDFKDNIGGLTNRLAINNGYGNNDLQSWLIKRLEVNKFDDVLDIGCGDGRHLFEIATKHATYGQCHGIDYDRDMIEKSKRLPMEEFNDVKPYNLRFNHFNMDEINTPSSPLKDQKYNVIYSLYAFYYSKDSIKLLDLLKSRLHDGGKISIIGPHGENNKGWFKFLNQFVQLDDSIMNSSYSFMDDIKSYAYSNFEMVVTEDFVNTITLPTYSDLKKYWESNIYYDSKYDAKFEELAKQHYDSEGEFSYNKFAKMITMGNVNG